MWHTNCHWWWGPGFFFGGPIGMMIGLLFWAGIIYGLVRLISGFIKPREIPATERSPLEILKRRYANGEMDAEEFAKRRKDLES